MRKLINKNLRLLIFIVIAVVLVSAFITYQQKSTTAQHVGNDLKISLNYPKGWYIDDRYRSILLTDYETNQNKNDSPSPEQMEIYISEFSNCFPTIEEDLKYPACGENKLDGPDEIVSKKTHKTLGGIFYKYVTKTPKGVENVYYFVVNDDRILQISKEPDPSQHEKEFEEIVNSIKFL